MASWREAATEQTQTDLDGLLESALEHTQQLLSDHREFYPFAFATSLDGQQRLVAVHAGDEQPLSADLVTSLISALTGDRDELRATAIVADVRLPELDTDAIKVTLEHAEGVALFVLLPYRADRFGSGVDYGDLQAGEAAPVIWPGESVQGG